MENRKSNIFLSSEDHDCAKFIVAGQEVLFDRSDLDLISPYKWNIRESGNTFYAYSSIRPTPFSQKTIQIHRFILGLTSCDRKTDVVDHINGNGLDNRRVNLRVCTQKENLQNQGKRGGSSKYFGVYLRPDSKKWTVKIYVEGKLKNFGTYFNEIDAARAYDLIAPELRGPFCRLNFPEIKDYKNHHPLMKVK